MTRFAATSRVKSTQRTKALNQVKSSHRTAAGLGRPALYCGYSIPYDFGAQGWTPGNQQLTDTVAGFSPSICQFGSGWSSGGVAIQFGNDKTVPNTIVWACDQIRLRGAIPCLDWYSQDNSQLTPPQPTWKTSYITAGNRDAYLNTFFTSVAAWGFPLFIRFDSEMNGSYRIFSDEATGMGNATGDFKAMWQHVHDRAVANGATNITWFWCPNQFDGTIRYSQYYPGDTYVDWLGVDVYNSTVAQWNTFQQIIDGKPGDNSPVSSYYELFTVNQSKPIYVGEHGCFERASDSGSGLSKLAWFQDAYIAQLLKNYPRVRAVSYFWQGIQQGSGQDYCPDTTTSALLGFQAGMKQPWFIKAGQQSIATSPIPAPTY